MIHKMIAVGAAVVMLLITAQPAAAQIGPADEIEDALNDGVSYCRPNAGGYTCWGAADGCVGTWWSSENGPNSDDKEWGKNVCTGDLID